MRRLVLLALVVPALAGCGFASLLFGGFPTSSAGGSSTVIGIERVPQVPDVKRWIQVEHLPARAVPGAKLFATAGCGACHTYAGSGSQNLNAPDLTTIGTRHLGIAFQIAHLKCPSCVNPGSPMPPFPLGKKRLREVAIFLEDSKGTH